MSEEQIKDFFDKNCSIDQQKFLLEFMEKFLNSGKKVKESIITIIKYKLNELDTKKDN